MPNYLMWDHPGPTKIPERPVRQKLMHLGFSKLQELNSKYRLARIMNAIKCKEHKEGTLGCKCPGFDKKGIEEKGEAALGAVLADPMLIQEHVKVPDTFGYLSTSEEDAYDRGYLYRITLPDDCTRILDINKAREEWTETNGTEFKKLHMSMKNAQVLLTNIGGYSVTALVHPKHVDTMFVTPVPASAIECVKNQGKEMKARKIVTYL